MSLYKNKTLMLPALVLVLVFIMKMFQSTIFEDQFFVLQAGFIGLFIVFGVIYITNALVRGDLPTLPMYFMLLMFAVPVYGAFRSNAEFGQPYIYGILSLREWFLIAGAVWIYYSIAFLKIPINTYRTAFVFLGWASLFVYTYFYLTFEPNIAGTPDSFVHLDENRGLRLRIQNFFITFGAIYYFIRLESYRRFSDFAAFALFLLFIMAVQQGRIFIVTLLTVIVLYIVFETSRRKVLLKLSFMMMVFIAGILFVSVFSPSYVENMGFMFEQMLIALSGELTEDASSNARLITLRQIFEYFSTNTTSVLLGTGNLSHHYNEGYDSVFGYFYPVDAGVVGGLFVYGIVGLFFVFIIPIILSVKMFRKTNAKSLSDPDQRAFLLSIKYLLLFSIVNLLGANLYFNVMYYVTPLFILYAYNRVANVS